MMMPSIFIDVFSYNHTWILSRFFKNSKIRLMAWVITLRTRGADDMVAGFSQTAGLKLPFSCNRKGCLLQLVAPVDETKQ